MPGLSNEGVVPLGAGKLSCRTTTGHWYVPSDFCLPPCIV